MDGGPLGVNTPSRDELSRTRVFKTLATWAIDARATLTRKFADATSVYSRPSESTWAARCGQPISSTTGALHGHQSPRPFGPARAGAEFRHGHVRRRQRFLQGLGINRLGRRVATDRRLSRSRREPVRHRRRLFRRARRTDPGRGDQRQAQPPAHLHQGDLPDGRRPERLWLLAPAYFGGSRGFAETPWRRDDRSPPIARPGLQHARSRRRCPRSISSCARAGSATSAARISPAGIS